MGNFPIAEERQALSDTSTYAWRRGTTGHRVAGESFALRPGSAGSEPAADAPRPGRDGEVERTTGFEPATLTLAR